MAKNKFYVDRYADDEPRPLPVPPDWDGFPTLKKAVRYARENGIPAEHICDRNGDPIPDLNLNDPQWKTHRELEEELGRAREQAKVIRKATARAIENTAALQQRVIAAGFIPVEVLASNLMDIRVENGGLGGTASLLFRLDPMAMAAVGPYDRQPLILALKAIQENMK